MQTIDAVVLGVGHCGLAMSRCLAERSIEHVVLERKEVANSWRTERWDALRLLTPNWQCRLPDYTYEGDDPDGFMTMPDVVNFITTVREEFSAPVREETRSQQYARRRWVPRRHRPGRLELHDGGDRNRRFNVPPSA